MAHQEKMMKDPSWWEESHSTGWERDKERLREEWEASERAEGNDDAGLDRQKDGIREGVSAAKIVSAGLGAWSNAEPAVRYGYGARHHYADDTWNDQVEERLRADWDATNGDSTWEHVKRAVRRGWDSVKGRA
jgi:hypothetical protein